MGQDLLASSADLDAPLDLIAIYDILLLTEMTDATGQAQKLTLGITVSQVYRCPVSGQAQRACHRRW